MSSPSAPLVWNNSLLLGDPEMDAIHQEFVACIGVVLNSDEGHVADALAALERQARSHFDMEDSWMRENDFPARDCHIDEHAAVLASIAGVRKRVAEGELAPAYDIARALAEWFPGHADYLDSALAAWMCKRRWGGKPVVIRRGAAGSNAEDPVSAWGAR